MNFHYEKLLITLLYTLYFDHIPVHTHCLPDGYSTTLIWEVNALAYFL